jgi:hypothetical protein
MTSWPAIGIVAGAEVAVFLGPTIRSFTAQARIDRERDGDIRAAIAGYETGLVIPALADLVEEVNEVRREDESISDALNRAEGTARKFEAAVDASIRSQSPRTWERSLVHRHLGCGACLLAAQIAGPVALYNVVTDGYNLSQTIVIVATVIFSIGVLGALALAILVVLGDNALTRAIREGRDAA